MDHATPPNPPAHVQREHAHPATVEATGQALRDALSEFAGPDVDLDQLAAFADRYAARLLSEGLKRAAAVTPEKRRAADRTMRALKTQAVQDAGSFGIRGMAAKAREFWQLLDTAATFAATFAPLAL